MDWKHKRVVIVGYRLSGRKLWDLDYIVQMDRNGRMQATSWKSQQNLGMDQAMRNKAEGGVRDGCQIPAGGTGLSWWPLLTFGRAENDRKIYIYSITMVLFLKSTYPAISHQNLYYQPSSNHHCIPPDFYDRLPVFRLSPCHIPAPIIYTDSIFTVRFIEL